MKKEILNKKTQKLLAEIDKDIKEGKNLVGPFSNADEMMRVLGGLSYDENK